MPPNTTAWGYWSQLNTPTCKFSLPIIFFRIDKDYSRINFETTSTEKKKDPPRFEEKNFCQVRGGLSRITTIRPAFTYPGRTTLAPIKEALP
jgi:hypothetical protein